ncbi:hypothetical protein [Bradyrhizobium sp. Ash2021]|uniref:hypothetical protein n=1 Tax=Bradyrhizobium sp. Ash2021 TaxID=2954771 RepID=UPI002815BC7A|nr:hypothetical protein [Bradyrhizobium sp. Ash2021]WMT78229.1 hypothetical protein NL528_18620 [Bradyrhizobium sp. Ash2021]
MRFVLLAGTVLALGNIAAAHSTDAVPDLKFELYCNFAADREQVEPENRSAFISTCQHEDEGAIPLVSQKWQYVPADIQGRCLEVAHDSYGRLNRCLDQVLDADPSSIPHTDLSESGRITRRFWTIGECLRHRPEGAVCIAR